MMPAKEPEQLLRNGDYAGMLAYLTRALQPIQMLVELWGQILDDAENLPSKLPGSSAAVAEAVWLLLPLMDPARMHPDRTEWPARVREAYESVHYHLTAVGLGAALFAARATHPDDRYDPILSAAMLAVSDGAERALEAAERAGSWRPAAVQVRPQPT